MRRPHVSALTAIALTSLTFVGPGQVTPPPTVAPPTSVDAKLNDGPYLFHQADGSVVAKWVAAGEVHQKRFAKGKAVELPRFAPFMGKRVQLKKHKPDPAVWKQPETMLVISDVEGQYDTTHTFLYRNGVVDKGGKWSFGKGHLVCVGDMVDRGTKVAETMWMLYRLSIEAQAAGGHVHYVIGNHEVMMMGGDVRYTAKKYHDVARLFGLPTEGIVGADTEIGRWWRSLNTLTRIGPYLFVHAGVSPQLGSKKLDLDRLNDAMRAVLGTPPTKIANRDLQALAWGRYGPLWYRGYFKEFALDFGPTPTASDLDDVLKNLGAKTIVIGHTKIKKIAPMFGARRVLPIDIPWTDASKVRGILVTGERVDVIDIRGKRTRLE